MQWLFKEWEESSASWTKMFILAAVSPLPNLPVFLHPAPVFFIKPCTARYAHARFFFSIYSNLLILWMKKLRPKEVMSPVRLTQAPYLVRAKLLSHVWLPANLWTIALQTPLSMRFSRQEYWSALPPGKLPDPGIKSTSLMSPELAGGFFTTSATLEALPLIL